MHSSVKLRMLEDRVAVVPEDLPEVTESGLFLPANREERMQVGRVLAHGPDARDIEDGDRVCFGAFAGTEIPTPLGDDPVVILKAEEILAKVAEHLRLSTSSLGPNYSDEATGYAQFPED